MEPGKPVIRFDPSGAKQQIDEHTANLRAAQANLDQALAQSRITSEQDRLDLAKAKYELEKAQLEASKQAIVSAIQGEESKIDSGLAEQKLRVQEATVNLHRKSDEAKIASLTRLRDQEQRELDIVKDQLGAMEIQSPSKGIITLSFEYVSRLAECAAFQSGRSRFSGRGAGRDTGPFHDPDRKQGR